jgi:hypothetical protein
MVLEKTFGMKDQSCPMLQCVYLEDQLFYVKDVPLALMHARVPTYKLCRMHYGVFCRTHLKLEQIQVWV